MKVLGISALYHDSAAALVIDGQIVAAAQEERFSRRKHDASLPEAAVAYCLEQAGLRMADVDHVVFYEKPLRKFSRLLDTHLASFPRGRRFFTRAMRIWLGKRLWLKGRLAETFGVDPGKILFSEHHLSHAAASFLTSPFERAAVITADGVGEEATTAIFHGVSDAQGARLTPVKELHFPHSMGLFYSTITAYLGFRVNNGEYKVMGLASYGQPTAVDALERVCDLAADGSLTLDMRYFAFHRSAERSFTPALEALLGPARPPGSALELPAAPGSDAQRWADVAASAQRLCERHLSALVVEAMRETGERHVCLSGGVALNSVANGRLAASGLCDGLYVPPAAGDSGGALGAALYVTHGPGGVPRRPEVPSPYLGRAYSQEEVRAFLGDCRIRHRVFEDEASLVEHVASRLATGEVGGWFQGRFEWGPRALGARSILADPRPEEMRDRLNAKIKFREGFRPFAPAVMASEASRWFQVDGGAHDHLTPHMLSVVPVTAEGRATLGAVTHVDGSARVQSVDPDRQPGFHRLLAAFQARTGVGCLLNTSMNLRGEPMCGSPGDAYSVFDRSDLDFLVLERCLVERAA